MDKDLQELRERYYQQLIDAENMGYTNRELIEEKERLYNEYKEKIEQLSLSYNDVKTESQKEKEDLRKKYDNQIEDLKEQLRNKSNEIQGLYKDNFSKNERIENLQAELNAIKNKYYKKEKDLNVEAERLHGLLQQEVQYQSTKAAEINNLNLIIQNLQDEKNALYAAKAT